MVNKNLIFVNHFLSGFCQVKLFLSSRGLSGFVRKETKGDVSKFFFDLWNVRDVFLFDVKE